MLGLEPHCAQRHCTEWNNVEPYYAQLGGISFLLWLCKRHRRFLERVPGLRLRKVEPN